MSAATVGVLLRKMVELEMQGADRFFGEPEFDVHDLLATTRDGRGVVTCLELSDVQDKPTLFSTFMMWMLAELYHNLPEAGDLDKPKLAFFFDEAHLLFDDASKALLEQVEQVVRLIRSKGVGVYFVTQTPKDVPADVLAQLSNRVQHALRAHTPDDETALKATVRTFPKTEFYDLGETLTSLGIGEAIVTVLDPRGVPTPVVATRLIPPASRMAPAHAGGAPGRHPSVGPAGPLRQVGRPGERPGDAGGPARAAPAPRAAARPGASRRRSWRHVGGGQTGHRRRRRAGHHDGPDSGSGAGARGAGNADGEEDTEHEPDQVVGLSVRAQRGIVYHVDPLLRSG